MTSERKARASQDLPVTAFPTPAAWEAWLATHHASSPGLWLKFAKKDSGIDSVTYPEALDGALCYGWIDGQVKRLDETYYLQRYTPRGPRSKWSKINRGKVAALTAAGRMKPAGLRQVDAAKADGRWDAAYDSPKTATVPDDLRRALDADPRAAAFFAALDGRNRYAILYQLQDARRPDTRARRIAKFVAMLAKGEKLYP
ncbi:MAG: hypothetical protein AVDCRST_MAG64-2429 [uncultured Phycisphaerae bacterium]|uniref:Periplasmic membrane protein n=1 Tax=uncultured Phycisphaerae bacterium TaxID=904963 RepID=A0A6J4PCG4_9BACT|nr:MAG: hypothetical protein AVDCRST_MAG64-2429 [uncultured Phycisphaerae bacterium]